jgi:hypothetical protein
MRWQSLARWIWCLVRWIDRNPTNEVTGEKGEEDVHRVPTAFQGARSGENRGAHVLPRHGARTFLALYFLSVMYRACPRFLPCRRLAEYVYPKNVAWISAWANQQTCEMK